MRYCIEIERPLPVSRRIGVTIRVLVERVVDTLAGMAQGAGFPETGMDPSLQRTGPA